MNVYLSSWYASKDTISERAKELEQVGIHITSRWLDEPHKPSTQTKDLSAEFLRETAILDIEDMFNADTIVLFTPSDADLETVPKRSWSRGGRNFEMGFFYAMALFWRTTSFRLIVCGPREGVFHWLYDLKGQMLFGMLLPEIQQFDTFEQVKEHLKQYV